MTWAQLCGLLRSRAKRRGLELVVDVRPWPDGGAVERIGNLLVVHIDSRRSAGDRLQTLAHEAGHILFGHYAFDDDLVWTQVETPREYDEWEREADFFALFATRTPGTPPEWFLREQLDLSLFTR